MILLVNKLIFKNKHIYFKIYYDLETGKCIYYTLKNWLPHKNPDGVGFTSGFNQIFKEVI